MILVVGNSIDLVETVINEIKCLSDEEVILFKADKCLDGESLSYSFLGSQMQMIANVDGCDIDLSSVRAIWFWKPLLPKSLRTLNPPSHQLFIYRQFLAMWRSIAGLLADRYWLNDYYKMISAEHKPYQLQVASMLGFSIPDTIVTSDPQKAIEFWGYCNKSMVIKSLVLSPSEDLVLFTNVVTEDLMTKVQRLRSSPVILQRLVSHKHELRITVVGNQVFSAEVISESKLDWRRSGIQVKPFVLPLDIETKCLNYVKALGLQYGCIDMIVTPNDEYVFLEINPNGQWDFVEKGAGLQIGKAIAHLLLRR